MRSYSQELRVLVIYMGCGMSRHIRSSALYLHLDHTFVYGIYGHMYTQQQRHIPAEPLLYLRGQKVPFRRPGVLLGPVVGPTHQSQSHHHAAVR